MKAVSLIVQFVIFFTIGLGFFLLASNLFTFQSGFIKRDFIDAGANLSISQISAVSIRATDSCKSCDNVSVKTDLKSIAGYIPTYKLSDGAINGITLKIEPENKIAQSSIHNLNHSITADTTEVSSSTITLTYDKIKNKLVIK